MSNPPNLTPPQLTAFEAWTKPLALMLQNTLEMLLAPGWTATLEGVSGWDTPQAFESDNLLADGAVAVVQLEKDTLSLPLGFGVTQALGLAIASELLGASAEGALTDLHLGALSEMQSQLLASLTQELNLRHKQSLATTPANFILAEAGLLTTAFDEGPVVGVTVQVSHPSNGPQGKLIHYLPQAVAIQLSNFLGAQGSQSETKGTKMDESGKNTFSVDDSQLEAILAGVSGVTDSATSSGGGQSSGPVTVSPVEFASFDNHISASGALNKNLELVMDVCLNLTVELGRTELPIKSVLELTRGSVIELNRIAGESVDLYANGKMIAKGEVVVIEDNFGLRITSIVSPADRLRGL